MQALVVDKNGVLYAATNPDGKVYRIERLASHGGQAETEPAKIKAGQRILLPRYISIPARNTYGTWLSTTPATCTSPPAIMAKSFG